jgi:hypothetical protein
LEKNPIFSKFIEMLLGPQKRFPQLRTKGNLYARRWLQYLGASASPELESSTSVPIQQQLSNWHMAADLISDVDSIENLD